MRVRSELPDEGAPPAGPFDEVGGMWINVGIAGGAVMYLGAIVMLVAGFSAIAPFVILPPVFLTLIGANSLLGGPRRPRPPARPIRPADRGTVPPDSGGPITNGRSGDPSGTDVPSHPSGGEPAGTE
ncbi:MAG: hypothetical protein ACYCV7_00930 [Acidimicrobiales bacterium]